MEWQPKPGETEQYEDTRKRNAGSEHVGNIL